MTQGQAARAARMIEQRYPHLKAEPYESTIFGAWAIEVRQRQPWKVELWTQDEVRKLCQT